MPIREMKPGDLRDVVSLYAEANKFTGKKAVLRWTRKELAGFPHYHFVYSTRGRVIGAISGKIHWGKGIIQDIAVEKSHRERHIGRALLKRLLEAFRKNGISSAHLWVHWKNAAAIPFYCINGFELKAVKHAKNIKDVPDGEALIFLAKNLTQT